MNINDMTTAFKILSWFIFFNIYCYCKRYMELNLFVYVLLTFCIPYLSYSNFRIKPRKGFSILFISIISTVILLNFSILTVLGTLLLILTLLIENKTIHPYFYGLSFTLLNFEIFNILNSNTFDFFVNYLFRLFLLLSC